MTKQELLNLAWKASENSYSPYSHYPVGACVLCKDGSTFMGANIENASFGLTNCAERSAIFATYSNGYRKNDIEALAIVVHADKVGAPCGACRQVLNELLNQDTPIYLGWNTGEMTTTIQELLPLAFGQEDLEA